MSDGIEPRTASPHEVAPLARALAAAFVDDPVFGWLLPVAEGRIARLERFFALELEHVVRPAGAAWTADGLGGACLTLPPGIWRMPLRSQVRHGRAFARVFGRRLPWAFGLLTTMERRHLREPHWYFPYIGVAPAAQGQGLGRALMGPTLEHCDRERLPAYLEATSSRNATLYRRLDFKDIAELRFAGSPPLVLMRREPRLRP